MKKIFFLTTLLSFNLLILSSINPVSAQNRIDNQGRRQGKWIKTDTDGSRIFEGEFKDGKEIGVFKYYYPDGKLKIRNTFTIPGRYCSHEAFDNQGRLIAKGFYDQQNRDSVWLFYNEEGKLIKRSSYRMGIKQGLHVIFTDQGDTAEVTNWLDNRRHGRWWKRVGRNGHITANYVNGKLEGRIVEYDDNGKMAREGNYKDGVKDGHNRLFEEGVPSVDETWSLGTLTDRKVRLSCPTEKWFSIYSIAYYLPKGSNGTSLYLNDGTRLICTESPDIVGQRLGDGPFVIVDRKSRLVANTNNIEGIEKDADGREILKLSPALPFSVFPDDECKKMVRSLNRIDELDQ